MGSAAYEFDEDERTEMLNGHIVMMAPQTMPHKFIADNIKSIFDKLLKGKPCKPIADGADVFLTKTDRVVPDFIVVCNKNIIKHTAIHGAPDLIVEILSTKTAKNDKGYKKDLYERCGVREYWIVHPVQRSIDVYALINGKYQLIDVHSLTPDRELAEMPDEEKAALVYDFSPYIFPELTVSLNDVFEDIDY